MLLLQTHTLELWGHTNMLKEAPQTEWKKLYQINHDVLVAFFYYASLNIWKIPPPSNQEFVCRIIAT